jgi:hypothetical protein
MLELKITNKIGNILRYPIHHHLLCVIGNATKRIKNNFTDSMDIGKYENKIILSL